MYQEASRIERTLEDVVATLRAWRVRSEVVLVDDGSADGTAEVARGAAARWGDEAVRIEVLLHEHNQGKGASVRTGLCRAEGDWVLMMDADNSTRLHELTKLVHAARGTSVGLVIGSRAVGDSVVRTKWRRRLAGRVFHACLVCMGLGLARDTQCGFKLYRRDVAQYLGEHAKENGFAFDVEHLLLAKRAGIAMREVGVAWLHKDGGSMRVIEEGKAMLRASWQIRRRVLGMPVPRTATPASAASRPGSSVPAPRARSAPEWSAALNGEVLVEVKPLSGLSAARIP
jgi:dolichyl-phosphate beta-glucosyltransferase